MLALLVVLGLIGCGRAPSAPEVGGDGAAEVVDKARPNVLLVSLDTVRPDHLGPYGYDRPTTPNIDRIAAEGVVFSRVWAQAPWTLPSHMSLFTSMLPSRNGVDSMQRVLPESIITLPQIMQRAGYDTAALVNNGQMRAHWGFDRGFDLWREFEVDTPQGACDHIIAQSLDWLAQREGDEPWFLFLHLFDAHDPYDPPAELKRKFGSTLSGEQARQLVWQARFPDRAIENPDTLRQVIGSYDGEIAWMDRELGRLLAQVPANTLIVLFSDHGEAFGEHGWMLHGATLYDEETRVALIMRLPDGAHGGSVVEAPAALLDVLPTMLSICGIEPHDAATGIDLLPVVRGEPAPRRVIVSETKAVLEGRILRSVIAGGHKLIYSLLDDATELYALGDEQRDLADARPAMVDTLRAHLRANLAVEDYWLFTVRGGGKFELSLRAAGADGGGAALFIPTAFDPRRDALQVAQAGDTLSWWAYPSGGTKRLYVEWSPPEGGWMLDVEHDDQRDPQAVRLGATAAAAPTLPVAGTQVTTMLEPGVMPSVADDAVGVWVTRHRTEAAAAERAPIKALDADTLRQLRSLGYIR